MGGERLSNEDRIKWSELRTLLIIVYKQPGRLEDAETNQPLTVEGLLKEHEAEMPDVRKRWEEVLKTIDRVPLRETRRHQQN